MNTLTDEENEQTQKFQLSKGPNKWGGKKKANMYNKRGKKRIKTKRQEKEEPTVFVLDCLVFGVTEDSREKNKTKIRLVR